MNSISKLLFAKSLRQSQTDAEKLIWRHLRSRRFLTLKFRRQRPIGPYIVDFCSMKALLVVELDGGQHALRHLEDGKRTSFLETLGYKVLRFWDNDVLLTQTRS